MSEKQAAISRRFQNVLAVLQEMAAEEEDQALALDAISKDAGEWHHGIVSGLGIAAHIIASVLKDCGEEGQDAQIGIPLYRHEKAAADQAGPGNRQQRDLPRAL